MYIGECPYTWEVCNMTCSQWNILVKQRIHNTESPFACDICNKAFRLVSSGNTYTYKVVSVHITDECH
jgi:hypothetical protein